MGTAKPSFKPSLYSISDRLIAFSNSISSKRTPIDFLIIGTSFDNFKALSSSLSSSLFSIKRS